MHSQPEIFERERERERKRERGEREGHIVTWAVAGYQFTMYTGGVGAVLVLS